MTTNELTSNLENLLEHNTFQPSQKRLMLKRRSKIKPVDVNQKELDDLQKQMNDKIKQLGIPQYQNHKKSDPKQMRFAQEVDENPTEMVLENPKASEELTTNKDDGLPFTHKASYAIHLSDDGSASYWCSNPVEDNEKVVTWQANMKKLHKLNKLWIEWSYSPGKFRILTSLQNDADWNVRQDWTDNQAIQQNEGDKSLHSSKRAYTEYIVFEENQLVSGIKIEMKQPLHGMFGIYKVIPWSSPVVVMIASLYDSGSIGEDCLVLPNGVGRRDEEIVIKECIQAISGGDNRELWTLMPDGQIKAYSNDDYCMESYKGILEPDQAKVTINLCVECQEKMDQREKWMLQSNGDIVLYKDKNLCLTTLGSQVNIVETYQQQIHVQASSQYDEQHIPSMIIDGDSDSFWISRVKTDEPEWIQLTFDFPLTLNEIKIQWKFPPLKFDVKVKLSLDEKEWQTLGGIEKKEIDDKESLTSQIKMNDREISGFRITMLSPDDNNMWNNESPVFSIVSIDLLSKSFRVGLQPCANDVKSKWKLIDAEFADQLQEPKREVQFEDFVKKSNLMHKTIGSMVKNPVKTEGMLQFGKKMKAKCTRFDEIMNDVDQTTKNSIQIQTQMFQEQVESFPGFMGSKGLEGLECNINIIEGKTQLRPLISDYNGGGSQNHPWLPKPDKNVIKNQQIFGAFGASTGFSIVPKNDDKSDEMRFKSEGVIQQVINIKSKLLNFVKQPDFQNDKDKTPPNAEKSKQENVQSDLRHWSTDIVGDRPELNRAIFYNSCKAIKDLYPYKKSGFYWLKPQCAPIPMKVFCDFELHIHGNDIIFFGSGKESNITELITQQEDVPKYCAQLGLEPIEIRHPQLIEHIIMYLKEINQLPRIEQDIIIPIAYDYTCDVGECKKKLKSLKSENTPIINDKIEPYMIEQKDQHNGVAIGPDGKVISFKFQDKPFIKGIICSTNPNPAPIDQQALELTCDTVLYQNDQFGKFEGNGYIVKCPRNCIEISKGKVWGTMVYKDDSSICLAAIHQGLIKNVRGGAFEIATEKGQAHYDPSSRFGVESQEFSEWMRSFVLNRVRDKCPIERLSPKFTHQQSPDEFLKYIEDQNKDAANLQFLETSNKVKNEENISNMTNINRIEREAQQLKKTMMGYSKLIKNNDSNIQSKAFNLRLAKMEQGEEEEGQQGEDVNTEGAVSDSDIVKNSTETTLSTEQAIQIIKKLHDPDYQDIKDQVTLVEDSMALKNILKKETGMLSTSDEGPDYIENTCRKPKFIQQNCLGKGVDKLQQHSDKTLRLINDHKNNFEQQLKYLTRFKTQNIDVKQKIEENFARITMDAGDQLIQCQFENSQDIISGHQDTYTVIGEKGFFVSFMVLEGYEQYDQKISFKFNSLEQSHFGIAFKYIDENNHYKFELEIKEQFQGKRLSRMLNGVNTILVEISDGGYLSGKWYDVQITHIMGEITVFMAEEGQTVAQVLYFHDDTIRKGTVALFSFDCLNVYFDNLKSEQQNCLNLVPLVTKQYTAPILQCSRFKESYKTTMELIWQVWDPENSVMGPSQWKYFDDDNKRPMVIRQCSQISSSTENQEGSYLVSTLERHCQNGAIITNFYAEQDGYIGLVFRYFDDENYYQFEIHSSKEGKGCQLRSRIQRQFKLIFQNKDCKYELKKWYTLKLIVSNNHLDAQMGIKNEKLISVIQLDLDQEFGSNGKFGLVSWGTPVEFDSFQVGPLQDFNIPEYIQEQEELKPSYEEVGNFHEHECTERKTKQQIQYYCKKEFPPDSQLLYHNQICEEKYCDVCCSKENDPLQPALINNCAKQCRLNQMIDESDEEDQIKEQAEFQAMGPLEKENYIEKQKEEKLEQLSKISNLLVKDTNNECPTPRNPTKNIYTACKEKFQDDQMQINRCNEDACNLCCSFSENIFENYQYSFLQRLMCHEDCLKVFRIHINSEI